MDFLLNFENYWKFISFSVNLVDINEKIVFGWSFPVSQHRHWTEAMGQRVGQDRQL